MPTLPTISEVKVQEHSSSGATSNSGSMDLKNISTKSRSRKNIDDTKDTKDTSEKSENEFKPIIPRNASQPAFTTHVQGLPKNGSVPFFDRIRKTSTSERYKPSLSAIKNSRTTLNSNGDMRKSLHLRLSTSSVMGSRNNNAEVDVRFYFLASFYTNIYLLLIERKLSDCIRFYRMVKVLFLPPANLVFQKRNSKFDRYRERIYFTAAAYLIYQNIRVKSHLQIIVKASFHYRNPFVGILKILTLKKRVKNVSNFSEIQMIQSINIF